MAIGSRVWNLSSSKLWPRSWRRIRPVTFCESVSGKVFSCILQNPPSLTWTVRCVVYNCIFNLWLLNIFYRTIRNCSRTKSFVPRNSISTVYIQLTLHAGFVDDTNVYRVTIHKTFEGNLATKPISIRFKNLHHSIGPDSNCLFRWCHLYLQSNFSWKSSTWALGRPKSFGSACKVENCGRSCYFGMVATRWRAAEAGHCYTEGHAGYVSTQMRLCSYLTFPVRSSGGPSVGFPKYCH